MLACSLEYLWADRRVELKRGSGVAESQSEKLFPSQVLQEVAALLPREEQMVVLNMVQRVARESSRRSKKTSGTYTSSSPKQLYRPRYGFHSERRSSLLNSR